MLIALHRNVASQVSWKITCFILFTGKQDKTTVEESLEAHLLFFVVFALQLKYSFLCMVLYFFLH